MSKGRWNQDEPRIYRLRADGAVLATVHEASWNFSIWLLEGRDVGGSAKSVYAAQRAVRKALRGGASAAPEPPEQPLRAL